MSNPRDFRALLAQDIAASVEEQRKIHPVPITNLLTPDLVCISVGDPVEKVYHVHRTLLCARDPVFKAGYGPNSLFVEGKSQTKELKFTDQMPQVTDIFVHWLYSDTGKFPSINVGGSSLPAIKEKSLPAYILLYTFADYRCIKTLEVEALKEIVDFYRRHTFFVLELILCFVDETTPAKSRLREFMARAWYYNQMRRSAGTTGQVAELAPRNTEFGEDLVLAMTGYAARRWNEPDSGF